MYNFASFRMMGYTVEILAWDERWDETSLRELAEESFHPGDLKVGRILPVYGDSDLLKGSLEAFLGGGDSSCLLTVGGAGFPPGDHVPDVTLGYLEQLIPGIPEAIRERGLTLGISASLFRGTAGTGEGGKLIINLPGEAAWLSSSLKFLAQVLEHALDKAGGDPSECGGKG
jgi:molybdopterin biosynthesis enzyme MoaB